jgi:hypothetical protein
MSTTGIYPKGSFPDHIHFITIAPSGSTGLLIEPYSLFSIAINFAERHKVSQKCDEILSAFENRATGTNAARSGLLLKSLLIVEIGRLFYV